MTGPERPDPTRPLPDPPQDLLDRHDARVLRPATALPAADGSRVDSTVYRSHELLVPVAAVADGPEIATFIVETLSRIDLVVAELGLIGEDGTPTGWADFRDRLLGADVPPRVVALTLQHDDRVVPDRPVDAWRAVQYLRFFAAQPQGLEAAGSVELNHLLFGGQYQPDTFGGVPITHPHGLGEWPEAAGGIASYTGRAPLRVLLEPPPRRDWTKNAGWRRPVVAVLDTGCGDHPWLGTADPDPVVVRGLPGNPLGSATYPAADADLDPYSEEPLLCILNAWAGHGSFIAGVVRQVAPDAQIRTIGLMHGDGVVYAADLVNVLDRLLGEVTAGNPDGFVDVISLSLGAYWEQINEAYRSSLADVLHDLGQAGVCVVASAGNDSAERRKFPAAFADRQPQPAVPLCSVGAVNPNGTRAAFSNEGTWVTFWQYGAAIVSTVPTAYQGGRTPALAAPGSPANTVVAPRDSIDPDDFSSGFARWSGTSFAAPRLAAKIAKHLLDNAHPLTALDGDSVRERAGAALADPTLADP